jgi:LPXTG-motif cell wall-anchored protein
MTRNTFKRPGLTLVVATTLLFTGPIAAYAAVGEADNATNNAGNTAAVSTSADGNNGIIKTEPGTSSATGGITITKTEINGRYGDKYSVNAPLDIRIDYAGNKVEKGAQFSVSLGEGLQIPNGFNGVDLKATALDGSEKTIGKCVAANGAFTCTVTEDIAQTLGGNGSIKNGFVKLEATLNKDSVGKTTTDVIVDNTKYTVGLGKGVVGEPTTPGNKKFCYSNGKSADGSYQFWCDIQAQGAPGQTVTITENRNDATFKTGITLTPVDNGDWTNPLLNKPAITKSEDGKSVTFTIPSDLTGDHLARIGVTVVTPEKTMTNTAVVNDEEVTTTVTWKAKGSSGAETGEDEKPVTPPPVTPTPEPTPEPSTPPTPSEPPTTPPNTPEPKPSEPPAPTPEPSNPPTPEPSKPPTPTPDPKPSEPPVEPPVTPEKPKPTPEPSKPPTEPPTTPAPKPKPSEPSVTPPAPKPEPKETPTPSQPKPPTPVTNTPAQPTPGSPSSPKGAITGLAKTGAYNTGMLIAGVASLVTAGGILLLVRRRQNNN